MYYKEGPIEDITFFMEQFAIMFTSQLLWPTMHTHYLEKCMSLVTAIKVVHSSVNNHNHDRNLIHTRGQLNQQCEIDRQRQHIFLRILAINECIDTCQY